MMMPLLLISLYVFSTSGGLVLIKLGTAGGLPVSFVDGSLRLNANPTVLLGILLYGISFFLYIYLISKFQLGFIIPLTTALVYIVVFIASYFVFHEVFTVIKIIAISMIVFGVMLLSISR